MELLAQLTKTGVGFYVMLACFGLVATWESLRPLRSPSASTTRRWLNNFLWYVLNTLVLHWALPASAIAWSVLVADRGWGLHSDLEIPFWGGIVLGLLMLDLAGYVGHVLIHKSALLWRLHAVHHSDVDFDCTTGFRFHPLEGLLTSAIKLAVIAGAGIPVLAVALYETWLGLQNLYGHANVRFPARLERVLRWLVITPDLHRIHHSMRLDESQRNYGIVFPWWDRLFGTYQSEPAEGHEAMRLGLAWHRHEASLRQLLLMPFQTGFPSTQERGD